MKKFGAVLALLCISISAHAVQEVTLKDTPALQALNWCKQSDGSVKEQTEPCGPDTTAVSSTSERTSGGPATFQPLDQKSAPTPAPANETKTDASAVKGEMSPEEKKAIMSDARKRMAKWLGFALIIAIVAKLLKRSFFLWLILGFLLRMVLVAANVISF